MNAARVVADLPGRCPEGSGPASYDASVDDDAKKPVRSTPPFPGGLAETRQLVRRRGGLAGLVVAAGLWLLGWVLGTVLPGAVGGVLSFVLAVMAVPFLPVFGIPAAGGPVRIGLAVVLSAGLWWTLGQMAAGRVTRGPVAGWREWTREFSLTGIGVWVGAIAALAIAALFLGYG